MAQTVIIRGPAQRDRAKSLIDAAPDGALVAIKEKGETRTEAQNRTIHLWFGEVAKQYGDRTAPEVKGYCHREWGIAIRLRDPVFSWIWGRSGAGLDYDAQCRLLATGELKVSSGMNVGELSEYMEGMSTHYRSQGFRLTDPEMQKYGDCE